MYAGQDEELAHADLGYVPQGSIGKPDSHHEVEHRRGSCKEDTANHALAIEHQEEGKVDQGRTRLLLHDDKPHGKENKDGTDNEVAPTGKVEIEGTYHLGDTKGSGKLGKLCRLKTERAYLYPRQTTLDVVGQHGRDKQQDYETYIYNIGKALHKAVVHTQDDTAQHKGSENPHHLHAATG